MKTYLKISVLLISGFGVTACSSDNQASKLDYQSTNNKVVSLEVPPDLRDPRQGELYTLPSGVKANPNALKPNPSQVTRSSKVLTPVKNAQIERAGNQRWLHVEGKDKAEMWSLVRAFWQDSGFTIENEEPQAGLLETEWAENRAKLPNDGVRKLFDKVGLGGVYSTGERDKFMVRMENSAKGGYDIFFTHKGLEEVYDSKNKDTTKWQPRANDANLEAAFLSRFMQYLGADEQQAAQQVAATQNSQSGTEFAKLETNNVLVYGNLERNVNRVGSALDRVGLNVQQFVSERNMFVVRPVPSESEVLKVANQKRGWLDKWRNKKDTTKDIKDNTQPETAAEMFVVMEVVNGGQRVHLLDQFGKTYQGADAKQLLNKLYLELR